MTLYNLIARYYNEIFPLDSARTDYIADRMSPGSRLYEAGCATGELAFSLADRGFSVRAVDLNEQMIDMAKDSAGSRYADLQFEARDMTDLPESLSFDAACCFGNTLPHLQDKKAIAVFFKSIYTHLSDGGFFTFQIINFDSVLKGDFSGFPVLETDDFKFERAYSEINSESLCFTITFTEKSFRSVMIDSVSLLTLKKSWIERALADAGFKNIRCLADYEGTDAKGDETALLFDCVKQGF